MFADCNDQQKTHNSIKKEEKRKSVIKLMMKFSLPYNDKCFRNYRLFKHPTAAHCWL